MTAALLASASAAHAQSTSAGGQLQQIPPAPDIPRAAPDIQFAPPAATPDEAPAGATMRVDTLRVTGATLFTPESLIVASGFQPGSELTLPEMRTIAARISAYYHARGYFLAQAYVPQQDAQSGAVTIPVIEGRYGAIGVTNSTNLSDGVARGILRGLDSGDIVANAPLERRLLLLSDLPGIRVRSTLAPGAAVGTSDLAVDITPGRRLTGSVEADNSGNRYTGEYRLGGTVNLNNALGIGDQLSVRILASTGGLAYGRASYQAPLGNLTLGVAYARIRYQLGREFENLDADGTADVASAYASYPLIRSRDANLYALATIEAKWFEDSIGLVSARSNKKSRVATLGFAADAHDDFGGGGWSNLSAGWHFGELDIESALERAADAATARTDGGFNKIAFGASRLQTLSGPLSLFASLRGQIAFDNLDTSEKMELGGAYGVRAYPEGEAFGDQGYIGTAEARLMLGQWASFVPGQLQASAFIDVGQVDYAHEPWFAGRNRSHRSGAGVALGWTGPDGLLLKASYAHRLGDQRVTSGPDRSGRFWFQIVKIF
ncbi:ShlB/FhaC/HecB family hemolysin secretion/activation protein [Sphingomonas sp. M1-B02]|uniref:ShlB/FhaC/HecB family hemolysin secretion/activation protein n=1 Tax=Sphingomonas sp. M1-B02 TaxID=3114300 RepID=UPI00223EADD7|nr:ShlB/FhaC/HecB family hemolysin secretion/activation protein [Sphingomonas sp. S6-11]UZK65885.1 ShlB/FhaC/HecB family hemolysin secretion/activation protein [Sphingomonas sp. S6-11]